MLSFGGDSPYSLSPLLGTLCGDHNLPTWYSICIRGERSQTGIGLDRTVEVDLHLLQGTVPKK